MEIFTGCSQKINANSDLKLYRPLHNPYFEWCIQESSVWSCCVNGLKCSDPTISLIDIVQFVKVLLFCFEFIDVYSLWMSIHNVHYWQSFIQFFFQDYLNLVPYFINTIIPSLPAAFPPNILPPNSVLIGDGPCSLSSSSRNTLSHFLVLFVIVPFIFYVFHWLYACLKSFHHRLTV